MGKLAHLGTWDGRHAAVQDVTVRFTALGLGQLAFQDVDQLEVDLVGTITHGGDGADHHGFDPWEAQGAKLISPLVLGVCGIWPRASGLNLPLRIRSLETTSAISCGNWPLPSHLKGRWRWGAHCRYRR